MEIALFDRQRVVALPVERLRAFADATAIHCFALPGKATSVLESLGCIEISLVSDRVIARLHRQFMNVPGATDVITFPHGEIVISATTASRQARLNLETVEREVARYIVHGFLHLHGHEDSDPDEAATMWRAQEQILDKLWPSPRRLRSQSE